MDESISNLRNAWFTFSFLFDHVANSEDPDQTPRSALGLHCLHRSHNGTQGTSGLSLLWTAFFDTGGYHLHISHVKGVFLLEALGSFRLSCCL